MQITERIKSIFESPEFKLELEELSSWAANIRQERPIVALFGKYFWRQGHKVVLEKNKCDLVVDGIRIEFKVHFDADIPLLEKELNKYAGDIETLMEAVAAGQKSPTWTICPGVYKDVIIKRPDIFVWILCARDLSRLTEDDLSRVCVATHQRNYNRNRPYELDQEFLETVDTFFEKLQELRKFSIEKATTVTNGWFPSTYHLMICDFSVDNLSRLKRFSTRARTKTYLDILRAADSKEIGKILTEVETRRRLA